MLMNHAHPSRERRTEEGPDSWRALYETADRRLAQTLLTCIAAMEFEVRLARFGDPVDLESGQDDSNDRIDPDEVALFEVQVLDTDYSPLAEVIEEIIEEQEQFDEFIVRWREDATRVDRRLLVTMIVIVSSLAVIGAIEL